MCRWASSGRLLLDRSAAKTLDDLVDFDRINRGTTRLTVGAANVRTSEMRYFDSRDDAARRRAT